MTGDSTGDFARLGELIRQHGVDRLSMGMSNDFEKAIECGATHIRAGSAIFGSQAPLRP